VLAPVRAAILAFGVYPQVLLDRIEPTTTRIVTQVDAEHPTFGPQGIPVAQGEGGG